MSLPILSRQFFDHNPPDKALFSRWKSKFAWSAKVLPVYEWDDILFVACLALPKTLPQLEQKVVFVLCDAETLAQTWEIYNSLAQPKAHLPNTVPGSLGSAVPTPPPVDSSDPFAALSQTQVGMKPTEGQNDFDQLATQFGVDLSQVEEESEESSSEKESKSESPAEEPEELKLSEDSDLLELGFKPQANSGTNASVVLEKTTISSPAISKPETENSVVAKKPEVKPQTEIAVAKKPVDEMTKSSISSPAAKVTAKATEEKRSTPVSTEVLYRKPGALSSNKELAEATRTGIKIQTPAQAQEFAQDLFKEMSYHYSKSMLLVKNSEGMVPWKWNENFTPSAESHPAIPLATPSPFRVVHKTQKSYHGYVVPNDINEKFFEEWNQSQVPEHLTISPIVVEDEVVGMILGIGNKDADNKTSLQLCEKLAASMSKQMVRQPDLFKAA